tara:strand:- start:117 stop:1535 length:1419 start_codon:yes stop_codon:yes gene_type:complete
MSEIKVNKISPRSGTDVTLGDSGDTFTIPAGATIVNNGTQTGFGREGSVNWQTGSIKTTTFTATNGEGYFVNTSSGAVTANLPAGSAGAIVAFADYTRTFNNNNLTVSPNGSEKIGGIAQDLTLDVNGQALTLVYVDGTEGWINVQNAEDTETGVSPFINATGGTITTCGNDKIHTFTGPGTFSVSRIATASPAPENNQVSYLVVAGGGGGGSSWRAGAGGAGGFREEKSPTTSYTASPIEGAGAISVTATDFPITVGGGGAGGGPNLSCKGADGSPSVFSTITSAGGGLGGEYNPSTPGDTTGQSGGSGGGGGGDNNGPSAKGSGNTPPVSPPQGSNGGDGQAGGPSSGGGGGGAGATGSPGSATATANTGGIGQPTNIAPASGTTGPAPGRYFAGGGGGGQYVTVGSANPAGGAGGGGSGGIESSPGTYTGGTNGTANTGGGGGGKSGTSSENLSGSGGSGIVVIRYKYQ